MNRELCGQMLSGIREEYIQEALRYAERKKHAFLSVAGRMGRIAACLVCFAALVMTLLTVATASGNFAAYEALCRLAPEVAERFLPVNVSCEDQGICMSVGAVSVHGNEAEIYVTLQDLEGGRIDGTTDMFDSYSIYTNCDQVGGCYLVDFDPGTQTATFRIDVRQIGSPIRGKKMTFGFSEFLSKKNEADLDLSDRVLSSLHEVKNAVPGVELENVRGCSYRESDPGRAKRQMIRYRFLEPTGTESFSPAEGVQIVNWGFVDGQLHVLAYYKDIFSSDNHGFVYLAKPDGESLLCFASVAYFDEERKGSYEEYLFDVSPDDDLSAYALRGRFWTCTSLTKGNWKVTFPIENRE